MEHDRTLLSPFGIRALFVDVKKSHSVLRPAKHMEAFRLLEVVYYISISFVHMNMHSWRKFRHRRVSATYTAVVDSNLKASILLCIPCVSCHWLLVQEALHVQCT
jgi:hypothetical protein